MVDTDRAGQDHLTTGKGLVDRILVYAIQLRTLNENMCLPCNPI